MNSSLPETLPILVVEDDHQLLKTIGDILRLRGYAPISSSTGMDALQIVSQCAPVAVAVVDLRLPDMDGIDLIARLHEVSEITQVVILTGNASVDSAVRAMRERSYDYLVKPVHPEQLLDSIGRAGERWQRQRAEIAMKDSEDRLRRVFDHSHDALIITDDHDRIVDANRAASEFIGLDHAALLTWTLDDLLVPAARGSTIDRFSKLRSGEWTLTNANGRNLIVDVRGASFAPGLYVHTLRDLTEQRRLEDELHHSQKMDAIGRLAGGVAHDFNNMLTAIGCYTEMLRDDFAPGDRRRDDVDEIIATTRRAAALTAQLLAFSRKQVLQPRVLKANTVVAEIERMLRRVIGAHITLVVHSDPDLWSARADPDQLGQVLLNLAINARDAMPKGGTLTIETANVTLRRPLTHRHGVVPAGNYVVFRVADTGTGMDESTQAQVFDPFFTTKEAGRGTGLGLSTAYGIVKQSGGHIELQSALNRGTTFSVYLPQVMGLPVEPKTGGQAVAEIGEAATILVVEDDASVRKLVAGILRRAGHTVLAASGGEEALELVASHWEPIQLAILDVVMPGLNGRQLAEKLATLPKRPIVLYMSGYNDDEVIHRGVRDLESRFLQKPFNAMELRQKVAEVMRPTRVVPDSGESSPPSK
jgi:hypothetical protein